MSQAKKRGRGYISQGERASRPLADWRYFKSAEHGGSFMALSAWSAYIRGNAKNQKPNRYPAGHIHKAFYISSDQK
jgi:hypothetical protein